MWDRNQSTSSRILYSLMFSHLIIFVLILIDRNLSQDYFIRYSSEDIPCLITQIDQLWIQCMINQSNPLKFFSRISSHPMNIELIPITIEYLQLPSNFFQDEHPFSKYHSIIFDMTKNSRLKQIDIPSEFISNLFSTKIYFILHQCGHPILHFPDGLLRYYSMEELFITYHNRSRTVTMKDYFSEECLLDEEIHFQNERIFYRSKNSMKLWINGILFSTLILLITIMMYIVHQKTMENTPSDMSNVSMR